MSASLALALAGAAPGQALAQAPDSAQAWARRGLALLATTQADSAGAVETLAYDQFDKIAQGWFTSLGPRRMQGARSILNFFEEQGVPAELAQDADLPQFAALTFSHPAYAGHAAVTYLYWFIGNEVRRQRLLLTGGKGLQLEAWWTGAQTGPYEVGLLDHRRTGETREMFFTLLRMAPNAEVWNVIQYGRREGIDFGGRGPARFVDLNDDATPEIASWTEAPPDPRFVPDMHLPPVLSERLWQRTDSGFVLFDRRTVPTPFATFVLFLRALEAGQTTAARALVTAPSVLTSARTLGLAAVKAKESWQALEAGAGNRWSQRMTFLYGTPRRDRGLEVAMKFVDGHWLVDKLTARKLQPPSQATAPNSPPPEPPVLVPPSAGPGK